MAKKKDEKPKAGEVFPVDVTDQIAQPETIIPTDSTVTSPQEFTIPEATVPVEVIIEPKEDRETVTVDKETLYRTLSLRLKTHRSYLSILLSGHRALGDLWLPQTL